MIAVKARLLALFVVIGLGLLLLLLTGCAGDNTAVSHGRTAFLWPVPPAQPMPTTHWWHRFASLPAMSTAVVGAGAVVTRDLPPNVVAVDFYRQGDLFRVVDALNGV